MIQRIVVDGKIRYLACYDAQIHMPESATILAHYEDMGSIWTYPIHHDPNFDIKSVDILDYVYDGVRNDRNRHQTQWVMRTNRNFSKFQWMGRASSMFISKRHGQHPQDYYIDFFGEDENHLWSGDPIMHDYLRDHFNNYDGYPYIKPACKGRDGGCQVLSGHIVPVFPSTREVANIVLLDAITEGQKYEDLNPHIQNVVNTLWANRHMVLDPHARLILPAQNVNN